jgi:hypothetical protein
VVLASDVGRLLTDDGWLATLTPGATEMRRQAWGPVTERRMLLPSGLPVEFGVTTAEWAALPLDAGTARVLGDGASLLYDAYGVVASALVAVSDGSRPTGRPATR